MQTDDVEREGETPGQGLCLSTITSFPRFNEIVRSNLLSKGTYFQKCLGCDLILSDLLVASALARHEKNLL
jgi:hypothetical protein